MTTTRPAPTATPELRGEQRPDRDGRYRLYTREHCAYDSFPRYRDGGPPMVTYDGWGTSTTGWGPATVHASRYHGDPREPWNPALLERHPLDGQTFPTPDDADRAKFDAGVLAFMVYEKYRASYGLPPVQE